MSPTNNTKEKGLILLAAFVGLTQFFASAFTCDEIIPDLCELDVLRRPIQVHGKELMTWTYSPSNSTISRPIRHLPLVVIHGGPALTHTYLLPIKQLACNGRQVIFYDQVGCGESFIPQDVHKDSPQILTEDYYIDEVETIASELGLKKINILGHGWGGVIALRYALSRHNRLNGMVLASTFPSSDSFARSQIERHSTLPPLVQRYLDKIETEHAYEDPTYQEVTKSLASFWITRTIPNPDCVDTAFRNMNKEVAHEIEHALMKNFDLTARIRGIKTPTLITYGQFDLISEKVQSEMIQAMRSARVIIYPHSGHMTMVDDAELTSADVESFLDGLESSNAWDKYSKKRKAVEMRRKDAKPRGDEL